MIMMIDEKALETQSDTATETEKTVREIVRELVNDLDDNEIISIPLEGMANDNGKTTK